MIQRDGGVDNASKFAIGPIESLGNSTGTFAEV
jgi:hypothetical protein